MRIPSSFTVNFDQVDDGWWVITIDEMPGVVTQGRDITHACNMLAEAIEIADDGEED